MKTFSSLPCTRTANVKCMQHGAHLLRASEEKKASTWDLVRVSRDNGTVESECWNWNTYRLMEIINIIDVDVSNDQTKGLTYTVDTDDLEQIDVEEKLLLVRFP